MGAGTGKWLDEGEQDVMIGLKAHDHAHIRFHYGDGSNDGQPDLLMTNWKVDSSNECVENSQLSDQSVGYGQSFSLSWTRMNKGPVSNSSCYYTNLILSTDRTIGDADDIRADRWQVCTSVPSGSTTHHSRTISASSAWPEDTYWVAFVIDADGEVSEADETNNIHFLAEQLTVSALPDLEAEVTGKQIMELRLMGGDVSGAILRTVSYRVSNEGYGDAPATEIVLRKNGAEVDRQSVGALAAGDSTTGSFSVGQGLWDQRIDWEIDVDPEGDIEETSESNNDDDFETNYIVPELDEDDIILPDDDDEPLDRLNPGP